MQGFNDQNIKKAQFYMDRKAAIKGKFISEQNIVNDGKVTVIKTKNKDRIKIKKFTYGRVVKKENDQLVVSFGHGNTADLIFKPVAGKKGNLIYQLQMDDVRTAGKGGKTLAKVNFNGHPINIKYQTNKHSFRRGKFSDRPSLLFMKKTKKTHKKEHITFEGSKV
jgi:hypothetical protein